MNERALQALAVAESIAAEPGISVAGFGVRLTAELADVAEPDWDEVLFSGPDVDVALELHRIAAQATAAAARQRQYDMTVVRRQLELVRLGRSLHDEFVAPAGTYGSPVAPEAVAFWRSATALFRRGAGRRRRPTPSAAASARRRRAGHLALWVAAGVVVAGAGSGAAFAIAHHSGTPSSVAVPRLAGLTATQARQMLLDLGLISGGQQAAPAGDAQPGTVIGTQPAAGSRLAPGSIVTLLVAGEASPSPAPASAPSSTEPTGGTPAASTPPSTPPSSSPPSLSPTPRSTPVPTKTRPPATGTPKPTKTAEPKPTPTATVTLSPASTPDPTPAPSNTSAPSDALVPSDTPSPSTSGSPTPAP